MKGALYFSTVIPSIARNGSLQKSPSNVIKHSLTSALSVFFNNLAFGQVRFLISLHRRRGGGSGAGIAVVLVLVIISATIWKGSVDCIATLTFRT
jgi:hypothetical protein